MEGQFNFMHCTGQYILHSAQIICELSQYYQIKLYGKFNNINAGVTTLAVKCRMSVVLTILTTMQWAISQYEW